MSKVEPCKSVRVTRLPCDDRYPIDIYISLLFAEASTATTTRTITTRPAAARGRDIKRKQFHSPWVHVLKIWFKRSCKADSNQTYKEESNFAGGGPVRKMPSIFPAGGGGGGISSNSLQGVPSYSSNPDPRPYFRIQTNIYPYLLKRLKK